MSSTTAAWVGVVLCASGLTGCVRGGNSSAAPKVLAIALDTGEAVSAQPELIGDRELAVGVPLALRAVLVDGAGNYLDEAEATWGLLGSDAVAADLSWPLPASASATLTPSAVGRLVVQVEYVGVDEAVAVGRATTGTLTVVSDGVAAGLHKTGGDGQSGVVGENLPELLRVQLRDGSGDPVQGTQIAFEVLQGDGLLLSPTPVVTDGVGQAAMLMRLGPRAGSRNNVVRARVVDQQSLSVEFVASAQPGATAQLAFVEQPRQAHATVPFGGQLVVAAQDRFGNQTSATDDLTLSVVAGSGSLSGTTTVAMIDGRAVFVDVAYSQLDSGVVLRARSAGVDPLEADSAPFEVLGLPPGRCQRSDSVFATAEGGCMDLLSGLVWSERSTRLVNWHEAVWDSRRAGSAAPLPSDGGRTNDYPAGVGCPSYCDADPEGYCHGLHEGGQTDWRLPTRAEVVAMTSRARAAEPPYLVGTTSEWIWTADSLSQRDDAYLYNLVSGQSGVGDKDDGRRAYCVRDPRRAAPARLSALAAPGSTGLLATNDRALEVAIVGADGERINAQGVEVRIVASSLGQLSGSLSGLTNSAGLASLRDWMLDAPGSAELTIEADGLAAIRHTLTVRDTGYRSEQGGCRQLATGLVWSRRSASLRSWYKAVWGTSVPPADDDDFGRTNDYPPTAVPCPSSCDGDPEAYCHDLNEGGFHDWRMPGYAELATLASHVGRDEAVCLSSVSSTPIWAADSWGSADGWLVDLATGQTAKGAKRDGRYVYCVRAGGRAWPARAEVLSGPETTAANATPTAPLVVGLRQADGQQVNAQGTTVSITGSSLGSLSGTTSAQTDAAGRASLAGWRLDTAGQAVLTIETPGLPTVTHSVTVTVPP